MNRVVFNKLHSLLLGNGSDIADFPFVENAVEHVARVEQFWSEGSGDELGVFGEFGNDLADLLSVGGVEGGVDLVE